MKSAKGMHLWFAKFKYTTLFILTEFRSPQLAISKANKAAKDQGITGSLDSLDHQGTIDA